MKKQMLEKKGTNLKSKLMAMFMAATMIFAMVPLGAGVAFADDNSLDQQDVTAVEQEEAAAVGQDEAAINGDVAINEEPEAEVGAMEIVEEEVAEEDAAVEAMVASPFIYASEIAANPDLLDSRGVLKLHQDTIIVIDTDLVIHGIDGNNETWNGNEVVGPVYNLTFRGEGKHQLTIKADNGSCQAIEATDITFESGNVFIEMSNGFGIMARENMYMNGGSVGMRITKSTWAPFYAGNSFTVNGGELSVNNLAEASTNGAIVCYDFAMSGGLVNANAKYGVGLWAEGNAVITDGTLNLKGDGKGFESDGTFKMTGGNLTATATREKDDFWAAVDFNKTKPEFGTNVKITNPANGIIGTFGFNNGDHYIVADKNGNNVRTATIKYVKPAAPIAKKANTMTLKGKTVKIKYKKLKKKAQSFAISKVLTVTRAQGKVTYKKVSGNKKISVASNGTVTVKKKLKKGSYKVTVKVTAAGNKYFKNATKTVTFTINVKKK